MTEVIKGIKDEILMQVEQDIHENGVGAIDGMMVDQIKDLAEAEKSCWEAEYYRAVTEAMEDGAMGYDGMGYDRQGGSQSGSGNRRGGRGYRQGSRGGSGYRRGYQGQPRDSQGQYMSRRGYRRMEGGYGHDDMMMELRQTMEQADPQERERLKKQLRQMAE